MALVAPLHMVSRYGNELYDYVSPQEVEGFNYVASIGPANIYGGYPAGTFQNTIQLDWRYGIQPGKNKPKWSPRMPGPPLSTIHKESFMSSMSRSVIPSI